MSWWLWGGFEHEFQEPLHDAMEVAAGVYREDQLARRSYTPGEPVDIPAMGDAITSALGEVDDRYDVLVEAPDGDGVPGAPLDPSVALVDGDRYGDVDAAAYLDLEAGTLYEAYRDVAAFRTVDWTDGSRLREQIRADAEEHTPVATDWRHTVTAPAVRVADGDGAAVVYAPDTDFAPDAPGPAERAATYLLVGEAGGAVTAGDGDDLAPQSLAADGELVAARDREVAATVADAAGLSRSYFVWDAEE